MPGVVHTPVVRSARSGRGDSRCAWCRLRPVVERVIPAGRGSDHGAWCQRGAVEGWSADAAGTPVVLDRRAEPAVVADRPCRCAQDRASFADQPERSIGVILTGAAAKLHRSASGARGRHSFFDMIKRIGLPEGLSCPSVVLVLVVQGVVRRPVVLNAPFCRRGTKARGAACPFWAA